MEKKKDESKNLLDLIKEKLVKIFQKTDNYTIEEYLKVLSDFTDSVILDSKRRINIYGWRSCIQK